MAHSEGLNQHLNQLATEVCQHPAGSLERQRLLNQLIYQMQQSGKIWLGRDIPQHYEDALQQTWLWFCKNIHRYDASKASVITWFNSYLRFRILDIYGQIADENTTRVTNRSENEDLNFIDPVDNLPAPDKPQPILEETLEWIEQSSELSRIHVRSCPHINCQVLLKHKLPPDAKTWRELAEKFGKRESTLNHFYNHKCFPCLLAFGRAQGYIDT